MSTQSDDANPTLDRVGYKRPPKHTRWRPGQSGNPSGQRRKEDFNLPSRIKAIFSDPIALRKGDKTFRVSALEAMLIALRNKAMSGDARAIREMFKIATEFNAIDSSNTTLPREFTDDFLNRLSISAVEEILEAYKKIDEEDKMKKEKG